MHVKSKAEIFIGTFAGARLSLASNQTKSFWAGNRGKCKRKTRLALCK